MSGDDTARILYLALLGGAVLLWFFAQNRQSWGRITQQAVVWALIFVGVIAAVGLWGDIRRTVVPGQAMNVEEGRIVLPRAPDGHYYLTAEVNGAPVRFVVDTGASQIVLGQADAERAGIDTGRLAYVGRAMTANGEVRTAPVTLDSLRVGPVVDRGLRAVVNRGEMDGSLLGMSYLQRFSNVQIGGGELVLER